LTPANGYILFFGTLEPRKNVGGLLDAYERLLDRSASAGRSHSAFIDFPFLERCQSTFPL